MEEERGAKFKLELVELEEFFTKRATVDGIVGEAKGATEARCSTS